MSHIKKSLTPHFPPGPLHLPGETVGEAQLREAREALRVKGEAEDA